MEERFVYPDVFDINRDYSTFAVAVYFCELIGREALINASDNKFEKFLRNILQISILFNEKVKSAMSKFASLAQRRFLSML